MSYNINQLANGDTDIVNPSGEKAVTFKKIGGLYAQHDRKVQFYDDFLGDALDARWSGAAGSDSPAAVSVATITTGGIATVKTGDSNASVAADTSSLTHGLNWKASGGNLVFEARCKVDAITNVKLFIGWTDTLATTTLEVPINMTTGTLTTTATDACGFMFDTAATNVKWQLTGVANDVDASVINSNVAPTAATYQIFKIELTTSGAATFYIDNVKYGSLSGAVTPSVLLTPVFCARAAGDTTPKSLDIDYVWISQTRI